MEGEIDETFVFQFIIPVSKQLSGGVVYCRFESRPVHSYSAIGLSLGCDPKLRLVDK